MAVCCVDLLIITSWCFTFWRNTLCVFFVFQKLDVEKEIIELVHSNPTETPDLPRRVPKDTPRYHFFLYKHSHEGDYLESIGMWLIPELWWCCSVLLQIHPTVLAADLLTIKKYLPELCVSGQKIAPLCAGGVSSWSKYWFSFSHCNIWGVSKSLKGWKCPVFWRKWHVFLV